MNTPLFDVSVIIVNYKTVELTVQCISSIYNKTKDISFEIIVIDNASDDSSAHIIKSTYPEVIVVENAQNLGFGKANNVGIHLAKGRNIFFLNSDTYLVNNAIKILSDFLDSHQEVGACGGNLYNANIKPAYSYSRVFPNSFSMLNDLFLGIPFKLLYGKNEHFNYTGKLMEVKSISGADLMIPARIINKTGSFDPNYFMYCEETDLQCRISQAGYKIISVPESEIVHLESASYRHNLTKMAHILSSRRYFILKNYSRLNYYTSNFLFFIIAILASLKNVLKVDFAAAKENYRVVKLFSGLIFPSLMNHKKQNTD